MPRDHIVGPRDHIVSLGYPFIRSAKVEGRFVLVWVIPLADLLKFPFFMKEVNPATGLSSYQKYRCTLHHKGEGPNGAKIQ